MIKIPKGSVILDTGKDEPYLVRSLEPVTDSLLARVETTEFRGVFECKIPHKRLNVSRFKHKVKLPYAIDFFAMRDICKEGLTILIKLEEYKRFQLRSEIYGECEDDLVKLRLKGLL